MDSKNKNQIDDKLPLPEVDFYLLINLFKKSIIWFVAFFILAFIGVKLFLHYTPNQYQSNLVFQFDAEEQAGNVFSLKEDDFGSELVSEVELMKSSVMLSKAIERMDMKVSYYAEGEILTNHLYKQSPYRIRVFDYDTKIENRPIYVLKEDGSIKIQTPDTIIENVNQGEIYDLPNIKFTLSNVLNDWLNQGSTNEDRLYFVLNNSEKYAKKIKKNVTIKVLNEDAKTIQISVKDPNKVFCYDLVEAIFKTFTAYKLDKKGQSASNILNFINDQLNGVYQELESSEILLHSFKKDNKMKNIEGFSSSYLERILEVENQIIKLNLESDLLRQIDVSTNQDKLDVYTLIATLAGTEYENSLAEMLNVLNDLLINKEQMMFSNTGVNSKVKNLEYQIEIQRKLIKSSIAAIQERLSEKALLLKKNLLELEETFYGLPEKELQFANLHRMVSINEKYYLLLLDKKSEYSISQQGFVSNTQILERATIPSLAIFPKHNMIYIIGFVIAFLLSGIVVIIKYVLHNTISGLVDIKKIIGEQANILGIVPRYNKNIPVSQLVVDINPKHYISEAFRTLRTNLNFIEAKTDRNIIAVTSTISGEGKTFVSLNLSGILALSEKKVIVLDLDLRKPKIHLGFGTTNDKGMSNLLVNPKDVELYVQKSSCEGLDFITAGPLPPNPSELIINGNLDLIINELKKVYDYVVIDTPPVGLVTDGISIIKNADYPIYVFKAEYSKKQFAHNFNRLKEENKVEHLSAVLNNLKVNKSGYGNSYGYGYGYGYGGDNSYVSN